VRTERPIHVGRVPEENFAFSLRRSGFWSYLVLGASCAGGACEVDVVSGIDGVGGVAEDCGTACVIAADALSGLGAK